MSKPYYTDMSFLQNLDCHPFTGTRTADFYARIPDEEPHILPYFNNSPKHEQIEDLTPGKTYHIIAVVGYGDCVDFIVTNDKGQTDQLGSWFFEAASAERT